jgi:hypothetical protein
MPEASALHPIYSVKYNATYIRLCIRANKVNTYQLENLSMAAHQSEIYVYP